METADANSTKSTVLIALLPEQGAFNASFMLARKLRERGCRVAYIGPPKFEEHVSRQGFEYVGLKAQEFLESGVENSNGLKTRQRKRTNYNYRKSYEWYKDSLRDIEQWVTCNRPKVALLDPLLWQFSPPLLKLRVPILGINTTLASTFDTNFPPVFSGIIPGASLNHSTRLRNLIAWIRSLSWALFRSLRDDLRLIWIFGLVDYRTYRPKSLVKKRHGVLRWGEYGQRLAVHELVLCPRDFDFPNVSSNQRIYVGSCIDPDRRDDHFDWAGIKKNRPLVYCSLGTYSHCYPHSKKLFSAVVGALKRGNLQGVIQVGESVDPQEFSPLPDSILVVRKAAQLHLLQHSSVFISHGGLSSVRESIYYGVPMIVFPCWLDQPGNAARVEYHHLGIRADISKVNEMMIRDLVERVQSERFHIAIRKMQNVFRHQENCQNGIDYVELFCREEVNCVANVAGFGCATTLRR
jgi:zeaxanthin glucosyltransferase